MDPDSLHLGSENLRGWLVRLLSTNQEWLRAKVKFFLPDVDLASSSEALDPEQRVILQLGELYTQGMATWQSFIHCMCMELEVPLDLEVPLLSTWGQDDELPRLLETGEKNQPGSQLHHGLKRPYQSCESSPHWKHSRKQRLELAESYLQLLRTSALKHYGDGLPGSGKIYVPPVLQWSRATVPLHAPKGAIMGDPKTEDGSDVSIQDLFNFKTPKSSRVTVLLGKAGMGKTTLARQLCHKWADGHLDHFRALFLFEFRQLNLIPHFLTLPQLLFDLYVRPESGPDAVFHFLEENASQVLLIFDGLDEALQPCSSQETVEPNGSGPAFTLFSSLCRGTLLPGCWVMATSRPGKLPACLPTEAAMVHMWGFDLLRVKQYMNHYFSDQPSQEVALTELLANGRLRSMCMVPALCQVACLCLHHLHSTSLRGQSVAFAPTVTQLYVQMLLTLSPLPAVSLVGLGKVALSGLETGKVIFYDRDIPPPMMVFGATHSLLTSFSIHTSPGHQETGYAFAHLSLQEFFAALYLMTSPTVDKGTLARHVVLNSRWVLRTKVRLGLAEYLSTFLAGLASHTCRPFLSQVAQQDETWVGTRQAAVVQLLRKFAIRKLTGPKVVELCHCVAETQEPELASLTAQSLPYQLLFHNFPLTYTDLAALVSVLEHRATPIHLEFEGCPLEPHSPEALAGCGQVETLSFKSRKCRDTFAEALSRSLPTMGNLKKLGLAGSKITARGISHLVQAVPLCPQLEQISLQDNQLKDQEVLSIVELLPSLPQLQKLDLSHSNFSMSTLFCLVKVAVTCPTVRTLRVTETDLVFFLSRSTETAADRQRAPDLPEKDSQWKDSKRRILALRLQRCQLRVHHVEVLVGLLQEGPWLEEVDLSGNQLEDEGCRLMVEAASHLHITGKLDLSDNELSVDGVSYVLRAVSTCRSLVGLHISLLQKTVVLTFAQEAEEQEGTQERAAFLDNFTFPAAFEPHRGIRLTHCGFQAEHLKKLCNALEGSCLLAHLGHLDFSGNALREEGAVLLAQLLPGLGPLQSLNLSENGVPLDTVFHLTQCLSTLQWVCHLEVSFESQHILLRGDKRGRDKLASGPLPEFSAEVQLSGFHKHCIPRSFCLKKCQLGPPSLTLLFTALEEWQGPLGVELSCKALSDQSLETLLHCLPRLPQLRLLQLSQTGLSLKSPFLLANVVSQCPRVRKVDLRSLHDATLHFRSSEEQEGVCCGFTGCSLSQEHVEPLCRALSKCDDLRQLDLTDNQLGDDGLRCLLGHLSQMPISELLDLSHNSISQEGVLHLLGTLPSCLRAQEASVNLGSTQIFWVRFSKQEAEMTLRLSECSFRPEHISRLASSLSQALQLTELTLTRCCLDLEQLTILLSLLRRPSGFLGLRVEEPWVGGAGVPALLEVCAQASGSVTVISISETQQQLCVQLRFPRQEENPEAVALRSAHCDLVTHHSLLVRQLMETCAQLQQLSLSQVNLCDASDATSLLLQSLLLSLCELKTFRLTSSCVSTQGLTHLASGLGHCHHLEELDFSNNQFGEQAAEVLMGALKGKCRLKTLRLSHLPLGGSTPAMLTRGLSHMSLLQHLCLSHIQIGDAGAQHLAAILPGLPRLRKIDLSANGISLAGGLQLAESLTLCGDLEEIRLGCNALGDPTTLTLAQGLPQHLRVLHLQSSRLGPEGALSLGRALDGCPHMEDISLAENKLANGVPRFCKGLPLLRRLDLGSCEIDNQTAKELAASFMLCPALEEILLSWNLLGDEAAAELAQVLPRMGRLRRVDLEKNRITAAGAWLLAKGLAQGSGVHVIRLWNNLVPPAMAQHLQSQEPRLDFTFFDNRTQAT
ncbi:protein NLRC5 isoform X1 [Fukomys damarensis]|uniref:protein NLRC5 isoform X1 n=1 Tax=Fukomys damarensis TaxID=885580 RepID=UPI00053FC0DD|nr:protein NLRC5 isoform X1 [Fukomys damarensis]XP_010637217.1 protein NLRC5 isoform X1 [Fukomys damarensis]XP_019065290.1 protein NLRC5 isoform X1 [Fukomys damarensis]